MKSVDQLADMLDDTSWGECFKRDEVEVISRFMNLQHFKKDDIIFRQGERQGYMAFIVDGEVDIIKESSDSLEKIVVTLYRRTHFGEMSFVDNEPRSATAVSTRETTLLVLSNAKFEEMLETHPKIGVKVLRNIAKLISKRLRMTTGKLVYTRT